MDLLLFLFHQRRWMWDVVVRSAMSLRLLCGSFCPVTSHFREIPLRVNPLNKTKQNVLPVTVREFCDSETSLLPSFLSHSNGYLALFLFFHPVCACMFSPVCLLRSFSCSKRVGVCWVSRPQWGVCWSCSACLGPWESGSISQCTCFSATLVFLTFI